MPTALVLDQQHRDRSAVFEELAGWSVPAHYGDPDGEYRAMRDDVAAIDRSIIGKVTVTGRDRQAFLQGMLSNDVKSLAPGHGTGAAFLDAHGKVMALLDVYVLEDRLWLALPPALTAKTLERLDHFRISEKAYFEPSDEAFAIVAVQGPRAAELLSRLAGRAIESAPYGHVEASIGGAPVRIVGRRDAGVPGFHCWTVALNAAALWSAVVDAGARPAGLQALDTHRIEAGVPWYGVDVDETVILPETRLDQLVSYSKGCYLGQEVVARVKYRGHVNRALSGLVVEGEEVPGHGARVMADDKEIGRVTSATRSPALGRPIALAYVRREHFAPGSAVAVETETGAIPARVAELPFVKAS